MILDEGLQQAELVLLNDVLREHTLLTRALRDLVFHETPIVLLDDREAVPVAQLLEVGLGLRILRLIKYEILAERAEDLLGFL